MSCVATFAAHSNSFVHNDVIRYPSLSAELAQKSRQTLVAKISSHTRLTVPPFFSILNSWFFSFYCNPNCFVHTRKHPPNVERLVFVQTCNINVRLSIEHHNVFFLLKTSKTRRIRNEKSTRAACSTALFANACNQIGSNAKWNNLDDTLWWTCPWISISSWANVAFDLLGSSLPTSALRVNFPCEYNITIRHKSNTAKNQPIEIVATSNWEIITMHNQSEHNWVIAVPTLALLLREQKPFWCVSHHCLLSNHLVKKKCALMFRALLKEFIRIQLGHVGRSWSWTLHADSKVTTPVFFVKMSVTLFSPMTFHKMISPSTTDSCINSMPTFTWWSFPFPFDWQLIAVGESTCPTDGIFQSAASWVKPMLSPHNFTAATSSASADERVTFLCVEHPGLQHVIPNLHSTTGGSAVRRQPAQPKCSFFLGSRTSGLPEVFLSHIVPIFSNASMLPLFGHCHPHAQFFDSKLYVRPVLAPCSLHVLQAACLQWSCHPPTIETSPADLLPVCWPCSRPSPWASWPRRMSLVLLICPTVLACTEYSVQDSTFFCFSLPVADYRRLNLISLL